MKFSCCRKVITDAVEAVQKSIWIKSAIANSRNMKIEVCDGKLKLQGNDNSLAIDYYIREVNIDLPGTAVVDSDLFGKIIGRMPEKEILFEKRKMDNCYEDKYDVLVLNIKCEEIEFNIKLFPDDNFVGMSGNIQKKQCIIVRQKYIRKMLQNVSSLYKKGDLDFNKRLIKIEQVGNSIELAGQKVDDNPWRIITAVTDGIGGDAISLKANLPVQYIKEISSIFELKDTEVDIYSSGKLVVFDTDIFKCMLADIEINDSLKRVAICQMIENAGFKVTVNRKEFSKCIERCLAISKEAEECPIVITVFEANLNIFRQVGNESVFDCMQIDSVADKHEISFNPITFCELLQCIECDNMDIYFESQNCYCIIKPAENNEVEYTLIHSIRTPEIRKA